ncbi:MAG: hypothetical protein AAFX78_02050 [Cyanobacteria bacterium J06638_20]
MAIVAAEQITISQAPGSSPSIPSVMLESFGENPPVRAEAYRVQLDGLTASRKGIFTGEQGTRIYSWELTCDLGEEDFLRLGELIRWQQIELLAKRDGRLNLTDEFNYLDPEPPPHSATLVSGSEVTFRGGAVETGYGIYKVFLVPQNGHGLHLGVINGQKHKQVILIASEVPQ